MTTTYDVLGDVEQVGGDLNIFSSNGWPFAPDDKSQWDAQVPRSSGFIQPVSAPEYAPSLVDSVIHDGDLHVVWVEPQWNGTQRMMRGPYVAKWDGVSWTNLGGEVDPAIYPLPLGVAQPSPVGPVGTHGAPSRPKILSDGTDLYVAYAVRELLTAPNQPPNGSYVQGAPCGCYVGGCDTRDWTVMAPRKAYVRKWSGSSWDLYGEFEPATNNGLTGINDSNGLDAEFFLEAYASPGSPGDVYVTMAESGGNSSVPRWISGPACIIGIQFGCYGNAPQWLGTRVALFNTSTGTAGSIQTIQETFDNSFSGDCTDSVYTSSGFTNIGGHTYVVNNGGTGYVIIFQNRAPATNRTLMLRFSDLAIIQELLTTDFPSVGAAEPIALAVDSSNDIVYIESAGCGTFFQILDDGSQPFVPLDYAAYGLTSAVPFGVCNGAFFTDKIATDMAHGNLFGITTINDSAGGGAGRWHLIQYHHDCPGWEEGVFVTGQPPATSQPAGEPIPAVNGDDVYVVGAFYNPADLTQDLKIQVYAAGICRDCASCAPVVNADPYIKATLSM